MNLKRKDRKIFYCEECQEKNKWSKTDKRSHGLCEVCKKDRYCYDGKIVKENDMRLGNKLYDKVSGFEGVAVIEQRTLSDEVSFALQPRISDKGELPKKEWFDANRLGVCENNKAGFN